MPTTYAIPNGRTAMNATLYTGTGNVAATQVNTDTGTTGFYPDVVWVKSRSNIYDHMLYDSVRGTGTSKSLGPNITGVEGADSAYANLTAFSSNGFSTGVTSNINILNNSGSNFVAWQWNAGSNTTSSNTSGTITSTVSANTTAGFSIVTYTGNGTAGATFGHGLGATPAMVVIKGLNATGDWQVYHQAIGNTGAVFLNLTLGTYTTNLAWNNTSPTSSVVTLGSGGDLNGNTKTYVAYCWAQIAGFSQFGSFVGNATTDNAFIYTGFRPKFVLMKRTDAADKWIIWDSSRNPYNYVANELYPNAPDVEGVASATYSLDFVSNGIKVRNAGITGTWIYATFAENPFKYANAR